jgi:hypothetical protein
MADQTEYINRLLNPVVREGEVIKDPNPAVREGELQMINSAQMGLMEMAPEETKDIVGNLEMTKQKVMGGGQLNEGESSLIMSILRTIGNALKGMMSGGETKTYFVDGKPVEMTEREVMGARNSGILVQDFETGMADIDNPRWNRN